MPSKIVLRPIVPGKKKWTQKKTYSPPPPKIWMVPYVNQIWHLIYKLISMHTWIFSSFIICCCRMPCCLRWNLCCNMIDSLALSHDDNCIACSSNSVWKHQACYNNKASVYLFQFSLNTFIFSITCIIICTCINI